MWVEVLPDGHPHPNYKSWASIQINLTQSVSNPMKYDEVHIQPKKSKDYPKSNWICNNRTVPVSDINKIKTSVA